MQSHLDFYVIIDNMNVKSFSIITLRIGNTRNISARIKEILNDSELFDLLEDRVISCHMPYCLSISS